MNGRTDKSRRLKRVLLAAVCGCGVTGEAVLAQDDSPRTAPTPLPVLTSNPILVYESLLHEAAARGDSELLGYLLDHGARLDAPAALDGATALHRASRAGALSAARLLVTRGADVNARAVGGYRPLHMAAAGGHPALARLLLARGADINAHSDGGTALHIAAREGQMALVSLLLRRGALLDIKGGDYAATALFLAAANGHRHVVATLLRRGADPTLRNREGTTALAAATRAGHDDVARLFVTDISEKAGPQP